jgi:hypothetical protein
VADERIKNQRDIAAAYPGTSPGAGPTGDVAPRSQGAKTRRHKEVAPPDDFETKEDFLAHVRKLYSDDRDADQENRDAAIEDAEFFAGKQWDDKIKARREGKRKPVLTVNRTIAFVGQIVGTRRMNETVIKILPEYGGKQAIAEKRGGLIRHCEKKSKADRARDTALQNCVIGGLGNYGIALDYARFDVFDQDINWREYPDAYSVTWDRLSVDKTGRDANHVFIEDTMSRTAYEDKYPGVEPSEFTDDQADLSGWFTSDDVRVVQFWRMRYRDCELALLQDGTVHDITDWPENDQRRLQIAIKPNGELFTRQTVRPFAECYVVSGTDILDGPYQLDISRVPVFRVPAWEITINGKRYRFGLLRFLKDPQRLHNYWRSTIAEKLMMTPRARWVASDAAVAGREAQWRNAHLSDDPLLIYNGESGQAPEYTQPAQLEVALIQESNMSVQDLRDVSNLHEASLGQQSNEVSGKAIVARQRVGDIGTIVYHDNLNAAIEEDGSVANEMIDIAYDAPRTIIVLGDDGKPQEQRINDPGDEASININEGRYGVTVTTGPSTATKRVEAQEAMLSVFNAAPQVFAQAADLWAEELDFPGAHKLAKRLRALLPSHLVDRSSLDTEEQAAFDKKAEGEAQSAQIQQQVETAQLQAQLAEIQAKTEKAKAEAAKAVADARYAEARADSEETRRELMQAQAEAARANGFKNISDALLNGNAPEADAQLENQANDEEATHGEISSLLHDDQTLAPIVEQEETGGE